jgi:hypothetical protein
MIPDNGARASKKEAMLKKTIGISAIGLLLGTSLAVAQTAVPTGPASGTRAPAVTGPGERGAIRSDQRSGTVVPPNRDPDSTNRSQQRPGTYHEELNNRGGVTGPQAPSAPGG